MKSGFVLIELIVATMIAAMISAVLLVALHQSGRVQVSVDNVIDMSERVAVVANQLEKDLAGAFIPVQAEQKKEAQSKQSAQTESADEKTDTEKKAAEKKDDSGKSGKKKEQKPLEKIFQSTNKDGMLDTLTFVTNNPLVVFVGKDVGVVKPKVVRVQYTLKPDPQNKGSYSLFRQESNELDLAEYKNVRPYELIGGIKKFSVSFTMRILRQAQDERKMDVAANKTKEKPKKSYEYKVQPEWTSEHKKEAGGKEGDKKEPELPRIPYSVECKITLWDKQNIKDQEFTIVCEIPVDSIEAQMQEKKQPAMKKEEPKADDSADKSQGQGQGQKVTHNKYVNPPEVIVYNEVEVLNNALNSLKKLLGHG